MCLFLLLSTHPLFFCLFVLQAGRQRPLWTDTKVRLHLLYFPLFFPVRVSLRLLSVTHHTYWHFSSDAEAGCRQRLAKGWTDVDVERREEEMDGDMKGGKRKGSWEGRDVTRLRSTAAAGSLNPTLRRQSDRSSEVGRRRGAEGLNKGPTLK